MSFFTTRGEPRTPGERLGEGAGGDVFRVSEQPERAMKIWRNPTSVDVARLRAQLQTSLPHDVPAVSGLVAWPLEELRDGRGEAVGFTMALARGSMPQKLFKLMHRCERDGLAGNLRFDVLLRIAAAAAGIAGHLHHHSVVIGDVNEVNAMTSCDGWTTWIDADSMQFADAAGNLHLSPYHRIEHLAPEFAGIDLARVPRTVASDDYAIAVLVFQLLMDGFHPFDAVDRLASSGDGQADRARSGLFAYDGSAHSIGPPLGAPSWDAVPDAVQAALKQTFAAGIQHPDARTRSWQLHHALLTGSGS